MASRKRTATRRWWPLVVLAALPCPQYVSAQIASGGDTTLFRSDAAGVRVEPQYQIDPLSIGPLKATISITARSAAESNVFRTSKNPSDDVYVELRPSIRVLAAIGAHSATWSASVATRQYAQFTGENQSDIDLTSAGRIDLGPRASATWRTGYASETEPRGSAGANLLAARPADLQLLQSSWSARGELGHLAVSASAGVVARSYGALTLSDGRQLDQSFRNTRTLRIAPRASFSVVPTATFFLGGSATRTTSLDRQQSALRDANGYTVITGFRSETNGLIIGEVGLGWRNQTYQNPLFKSFRGVTYDATVDWYPTRLISFRLQAGQDIVNSGLPTVAGIVRNSLAARIYYDPLRNLRFLVALDHDHDAFRELDLKTNTATATLTTRYQVGRHIDLSTYARIVSKRTSDRKQLEGYNSVAVGVAITGVL
jgi:hypothetical protein